MKTVLFLLAILGLLALVYTGLSYAGQLSDNAARIEQARAAIEAARAAQDAAQAARIAAAGLGATSFINSLILLLLAVTLLVAAAGGLYYLVVIRRQQAQPKREWLPGPNAHWGRAGLRASLPQPTAQDILNAMLYQQIVSGKLQLPSLPPPDEPGDDGELRW